MYPGVGDFNQFFGPTSVEAFLDTRNDACITCLSEDAPCVEALPNCCEGLVCEAGGFFDDGPTCQNEGGIFPDKEEEDEEDEEDEDKGPPKA